MKRSTPGTAQVRDEPPRYGSMVRRRAISPGNGRSVSATRQVEKRGRWCVRVPDRDVRSDLIEQRKTCENCGLPSWVAIDEGVSITIQKKPENRFQKTRRRTVWCHSEECAVQCLAVSKYGSASHKWPVRLAEFRATQPLSQISAGKHNKRMRASTKAKALVWNLRPLPTAKVNNPGPLESGA